MNRLAGESIIPAQTKLFHCSHYLTDLILSGEFDPARSNHDNAMFFTLSPTPRTNTVASASSDLRVFDYPSLTPSEVIRLEELGAGNLWAGAASIGFDGRLFDNPDPFAEISAGEYATELVVFEQSLQKLVSIRAYEA